MTHIEFLRSQGACTDGVQYASQHPTLDAAIKACTEYAWLTWAVDHLLDEPQRVAVRCYIVRHTPLADGRTVWDLLTDERSRKRIEIEEAWARGEDVSDDDRAAASAAASAAAWAWQMDYIRSLDWTQVHQTQSVTEAT